jgi:hypothetical protein
MLRSGNGHPARLAGHPVTSPHPAKSPSHFRRIARMRRSEESSTTIEFCRYHRASAKAVRSIRAA